MLHETMVEAVGHTPLVKLRCGGGESATVYAKLELQNLFGMKDRVGLQVILDAKADGSLKDGAHIIESSSGTMALGLALVGTYMGHPVHIVTDARTDALTLAKLRAIGSTVEVVREMGPEGWQSTRLGRLAELLDENPEAFCPHQYENPSNPAAYSSAAREIIEDLGRVDVLVASVGSGGSLCGTARALKAANPALRVIAVDAVGSVIFAQPDIPDRLQGGHGNSVVPKNVDLGVIDEIHWMSDAECFQSTLRLALEEKIFAGNSSGCVYKVAEWVARSMGPNQRVVAIFPDRGDRYHHSIFNPDFIQSRNLDRSDLPQTPHQVPYGTVVHQWSRAMLSDPQQGQTRRAGE
ncbi:cysteine synthase family protein [Caulobacter sp. S45]|uniref:cysteine synthase family protein n=1 Tax=Caulobacter sp. S45 TaxID=1641861 RepID=UPI00131B99F4|nr:cysteine synthase family protein [Caulobacter sp. S45]